MPAVGGGTGGGSVEVDGGDDAGVDGGTYDAGVDGGNDSGVDGGGDAGVNDAGVPDAGPPPELCDGIDNNFDGLIDNSPYGGPLTQACPLTLGVCATAVSICDAGSWGPCDYGPNYQLTERNCDGLDNDCDGRVDTSRKVILFSDAGTYRAAGIESARQQLVRVGNGFRLVVASLFLDFDEDLNASPATFPLPYVGNDWSRMFQDGSDWFRFQTYPDTVNLNVCMRAQRMLADGGTDFSDGGADILADTCWPSSAFVSADTLATADGFITAAGMLGSFTSTPAPSVFWMMYQLDGGLTTGSYDAGLCVPGKSYCDVAIDDVSARFVAWYQVSDPLVITSFIPPDAVVVEAQIPNPNNACRGTVNPLGYVCSDQFISSWSYLDGGALVAPFMGYALTDVHGAPSRILALTFDAGYPETFALAEVIDGGLQTYADFDDHPLAWNFKVVNLGGQLQLVLWGEGQPNGTCPNCTITAFSAEYVCAP